MPTLKAKAASQFRGLCLFLRAEVGLTRLRTALARLKKPPVTGTAPQKSAASPQVATDQAAAPGALAPSAGLRDDAAELRRTLDARGRELNRVRHKLAVTEERLAELRARGAANGNVVPLGGIPPENVIWIFGAGRTGSTWLSAMMGDFDDHAEWREPLVGDLFGSAYLRARDWVRERKEFVLGNEYKDVWLKSICTFILDGANARYPEVAGSGYLVIKEPNGSTGAPLLAQALPQSRLILLVRDPRDVVASLLAAHSDGSWIARTGSGDPLADADPDEFVRQYAHAYMGSMLKAKEAYENHEGRKTVVRYEDLRHNAVEELTRIYSGIGVPVDEDQLRRAVERHDWENIPAELKGADKPNRKAEPGCYEDDLTPRQIDVVEEVSAPVLDEFYPERVG